MQRDIRIGLLINPTEKATLDKLAEHEGEAVAVVLRRLIRREARIRGLWPSQKNQIREVQHET